VPAARRDHRDDDQQQLELEHFDHDHSADHDHDSEHQHPDGQPRNLDFAALHDCNFADQFGYYIHRQR
jgi:hypothetical protein